MAPLDFHTLRMQGLSIRKIAALRGVSRNAVRRALRSPQAPTGKRNRPQGLKLAPYLDTISSWLADPVKSLWTGERMFDELQIIGYDGGRTVLKDYLQTRRRRHQPAEQRFFVRPGQQMQVDWGELGVVELGSHRTKLYVFVAVMAWSRALFVRFTTDMQMLTWLDCHRRAFVFFGGVPKQVFVDNLKTAVTSRVGENVIWNAKYNEFAVAHQFIPKACWPARPKTKGRVERMVRYVRERFFVGRDLGDLALLNAEAGQWLLERANRRIHRAIGEMPESRLASEQRFSTSSRNTIWYSKSRASPMPTAWFAIARFAIRYRKSMLACRSSCNFGSMASLSSSAVKSSGVTSTRRLASL